MLYIKHKDEGCGVICHRVNAFKDLPQSSGKKGLADNANAVRLQNAVSDAAVNARLARLTDFANEFGNLKFTVPSGDIRIVDSRFRELANKYNIPKDVINEIMDMTRSKVPQNISPSKYHEQMSLDVLNWIMKAGNKVYKMW